MKSPLPLTAAIALKEAAACINDARQICRKLGEHTADRELQSHQAGIEPIARALNKRAQNNAKT